MRGLRFWLLAVIALNTFLVDCHCLALQIVDARSGLPSTGLPLAYSQAATSSQPTMEGTVPFDPVALAMRSDASLNAVAQVTEDHLVAVGDCGQILFTLDGGRSWEAAPAVTTANLQGVAFDGPIGYAVGGWIGNFTGDSHCVLLRSEDGGKSWSVLPSEQLPRLRGIALRGGRIVAWGDVSAVLQGSVFESLDGGSSWHVALTGLTHVTAAAVAENGSIGAIDRLGRGTMTELGAKLPVTQADIPMAALLNTGSRWVAGGESGELIASLDGQQWQNISLPLTPEARRVCRWQTMEQFGSHLWIAGSPGSIVLHSPDRGINWKVQQVGQALPVHDLCFVDQHRGWAVGSQGLIYATRDGGKSWYAQRRQPDRSGILAAMSKSEQLPWAPLVAAVWDAHVTVNTIATRYGDPIENADGHPSQFDGIADWAPQIGLTSHTACSTLRDSTDQAIHRLAVQLLVWRPDVLLLADAANTQRAAENHVWASAVQQAANADAGLQIAQELGLSAWQVKKMVTVTDERNSNYSEQSQRILREPGLSIWDVLLALPRRLRSSSPVHMQTTWSASQTQAALSGLLDGIPPSPATRKLGEVSSIGNYQLVMGRVHRERILEQLVGMEAGDGDQRWLEELEFFVNSLPEREMLDAMNHLANRLAEVRQFEKRQQVLERIIALHPRSDAADWARYQQLVASSSGELRCWDEPLPETSAEARQVMELVATTGKSSQPIDGVQSSVRNGTWTGSPFDKQEQREISAVVTASAEVPVSGPLTELERAQTWLRYSERLLRDASNLRSRPDMQLLFAKNLRLVNNEPAQRLMLEQILRQTHLIGWTQAAKQELAIINHQTAQLKWLATAPYAYLPPVLDGVFDESFWRDSKPMQLSAWDEAPVQLSGNEQPGTELRWGYDEEYIYLGISASRDSRLPIAPKVKERTYDTDLQGTDHFEIHLDTDRDYATTIVLGVSENGATYDRCMGLPGYNPKWHVFVAQGAERWQAEIAIRRDSLTPSGTLGGEAWAVAARRLRTDGVIESWSQLKTNQMLPQGSGLLQFESEAVSDQPPARIDGFSLPLQQP